MSDVISNETFEGTIREPRMGFRGRSIGHKKMVFNFKLKPHSYRVFKIE